MEYNFHHHFKTSFFKQVVEDLLASYDIINSKDKQGNTALHVAAYRGYLAVVDILISSHPSTASITNNDGDTFLHMAVAGFRMPGFQRLDRQIELMKQLVSGQIVDVQSIINARNNEGKTALHMAVTENINSELVELLLTSETIDLNICDNDGMTPLDLLRQRPQSASSQLLMKQLKSVGGISRFPSEKNKCAVLSHLKMQGTIAGSPGTSFRIPDADIVAFTDTESTKVFNYDPPSAAAYDMCSGELSEYDLLDKPNSLGNKKFGSVNYATRRLKILLHWPKKKDTKANDGAMGDDHSLVSYSSINGCSNYNQDSLRQRFSRNTSILNKKRILPFQNSLPSPSAKQKFTTGLMRGVLQVTPKFSLKSPSSCYSESSKSSAISFNKLKGNDLEKAGCISSSSSLVNGEISQRYSRHGSFNKRLLNQYLCFGAQGIAVDDSVSCTRQAHQNYSVQYDSDIVSSSR